MATESPVRKSEISAADVLSIYEEIVPLLSHNPENIDIEFQINKAILRFVKFDCIHYIMDTPHPSSERFYMDFEKWSVGALAKEFTDINLRQSEKRDDERFSEKIEKQYADMINYISPEYPGKEFHYHQLQSTKEPKIAVGFFRVKEMTSDTSFTANEVCIFESLAPHILSLFRATLTQSKFSKTYQYFNAYPEIFSKITHEYNLSDTEHKFLPEILFGYTNDEIATRHFISVVTVKKHIQHIFKKTDSKNRVDFISKFFTSPERVSL